FLGFKLQFLRFFLVFSLAQLLGKLVTQLGHFGIGFYEFLQVLIADRRSSRLTLFILLLSGSASGLGHDSRSADPEGGKSDGGGQCLEIVHEVLLLQLKVTESIHYPCQLSQNQNKQLIYK